MTNFVHKKIETKILTLTKNILHINSNRSEVLIYLIQSEHLRTTICCNITFYPKIFKRLTDNLLSLGNFSGLLKFPQHFLMRMLNENRRDCKKGKMEFLGTM